MARVSAAVTGSARRVVPRDPVLDRITRTLIAKHGCHTVILYGSRAREDHTSRSDYDVVGVSARAREMSRIGRKIGGEYWDVFIYPEASLRKPGESHLSMKDGRVLLEKDGFGTKFLARLERLHRAGPKKLPAWEVRLKKTWLEKTLERSRERNAEGDFRRLWLVIGCLEDYFVLRKRWYRGSKESLAWLEEHEPSLHRLFARALKSPHDDAVVKRLVGRVVGRA